MNEAPSLPARQPRGVVILGVLFDDITLDETLDEIGRMIARRQPAWLATANLDFAAQAHRDVELQRILLDAHRVLCDGTPLVWASRWLGAPIRERAAGSDLLPRLAARAEKEGWRLYFLGSSDEVLREAKARLLQRHPRLQVVGMEAPPHAPLLSMDHNSIVSRIVAARPDILLVALGCPKQEKWIWMNHRRAGVPCSIGIGASLDFVAGKVARAPVWMRRSGTEWVFRLAQEPRRLLRRYLLDLVFFVTGLWRQLRRTRSRAAFSAPAPPPAAPATSSLAWVGRVDAARVAGGDPVAWPRRPLPEAGVVLDLSGVTFMDSTGMGRLLRLRKEVRENGGSLALCNPSAQVRGLLHDFNLDRAFLIAEDADEAHRRLRARRFHEALDASEEEGGATLRVRLRGEITLRWLEGHQHMLPSLWNAHPAARTLRVDMREVTFLDTSGLGHLLNCRKLATAREGGALFLERVPPNVANVLRIAKVERHLMP
jgi:exopolysaccharide biosynthesis WecB/TagA/CpsF family protein/anti-anti-sigma factor